MFAESKLDPGFGRDPLTSSLAKLRSLFSWSWCVVFQGDSKTHIFNTKLFKMTSALVYCENKAEFLAADRVVFSRTVPASTRASNPGCFICQTTR